MPVFLLPWVWSRRNIYIFIGPNFTGLGQRENNVYSTMGLVKGIEAHVFPGLGPRGNNISPTMGLVKEEQRSPQFPWAWSEGKQFPLPGVWSKRGKEAQVFPSLTLGLALVGSTDWPSASSSDSTSSAVVGFSLSSRPFTASTHIPYQCCNITHWLVQVLMKLMEIALKSATELFNI